MSDHDPRLTPAAIRISLTSTLTGVNLAIDPGPSRQDPMGQRQLVTNHPDLNTALAAIPARVMSYIADIEAVEERER